MNTNGSHAVSSQNTLSEEASGQRMCSLFSQGECIEARGAIRSVDLVERLVALGETRTQDNEDAYVFQFVNSDEDIDVLLTNEANEDFNDDGHEDPKIGEALHNNPHIPFFTNLVGADDVVGGRDLYDSFSTWSDVTPEFAKGMVFKDKDAVLHACARDLPITSCVEVTFYHLVATFNDKRRQIESALAKGLRYTSKVQAKLEEYQARSAGHHVTICNWAFGSAEIVTSTVGTTGNHKHAVYLNPLSCDFEKWMIYHYPCSHMLVVCAKSGRQPWHLIDPKYSMNVYAHVYDTSFESMVHEHYWAAYDGPKIILHLNHRRDSTSGRPMDDVGSLGPIDGTVLTLQVHHRSTWIWEHGVTWRPYDAIMHEHSDYCRVASDIWVSRSPLICFKVVEWHLPDRVCRQLGLRQVVPESPNNLPVLHGIDMRGRARTDWTKFHREHIDRWHQRREYLVVRVIDVIAMLYDDPYMVWYRCITRTLVENPAHRPTSGYVEIGSMIKITTHYIVVIHDRIDCAIYAYDRTESLQDMYDARDMCSRLLHALCEHQRIGQPGVPEPPPTIPPRVPTTSLAMPPAFLVHPPPSTSSSQQFTQYVGAIQTSASYVTPTMPSYMYHIS
ncbi:hypothetical protein Acr_05g0010700 [Actinidia rufa]|uniref:Aminotransferase-like plant mobile domain-containing protein n=1 Tax=Actinidia rufa TaxID=165716 RepID=A0A7J0ELT3_9ERIC|nr:hypothetical protein Acr_05g0010700 [Actinidia rufa]